MTGRTCERCGTVATIRYRIQSEEGGPWQLVCPPCQATASQDNPHYRYGGTWKARRKKR